MELFLKYCAHPYIHYPIPVIATLSPRSSFPSTLAVAILLPNKTSTSPPSVLNSFLHVHRCTMLVHFLTHTLALASTFASPPHRNKALPPRSALNRTHAVAHTIHCYHLHFQAPHPLHGHTTENQSWTCRFLPHALLHKQLPTLTALPKITLLPTLVPRRYNGIPFQSETFMRTTAAELASTCLLQNPASPLLQLRSRFSNVIDFINPCICAYNSLTLLLHRQLSPNPFTRRNHFSGLFAVLEMCHCAHNSQLWPKYSRPYAHPTEYFFQSRFYYVLVPCPLYCRICGARALGS